MSEIGHNERRVERTGSAISPSRNLEGGAGLYKLVSEFWIPAAKAVERAGEKIAKGKKK